MTPEDIVSRHAAYVATLREARKANARRLAYGTGAVQHETNVLAIRNGEANG
ncbi:MAG: hypothetical protein ABSH36_11005 [Solirubrobacteraceae bacterium]